MKQSILALALALAVVSGGAAPALADNAVSAVNKFNRLMKAPVDTNAPPTRDGIHDPKNPGTEMLQPPKEAFGDMPPGMSGNRVDWVKALRTGAIQPRTDRDDPKAQKQVMDLDIIREVKGTMPDVVYPHQQHTEWLDCAQCHPKIFVPKKGGNPISMAAILMGQYCGVCHGKVAFPVSECGRCHSKPKKPGSNQAARAPVPAVQPAAVIAPAAASPAAPAKAMAKDALMNKGKAVYADNCAGCHGENGEGTPGTFPALKGSKIVRGSIDGHMRVVLKGVAGSAMTPWEDSLSDEDIASVVTFERNSWGNNTGDLVQPAAVRAAR